MMGLIHRVAAWVRLLLVTLLGCAPVQRPPVPITPIPVTAPLKVPAPPTRGDCHFEPTTNPMCPVRGTCRNRETGITLYIEACKDAESDL